MDLYSRPLVLKNLRSGRPLLAYHAPSSSQVGLSSSIQHSEILVQLLVHISRNQVNYFVGIFIPVIGVKGIVVPLSVGELHVDGRVAVAYQVEVQEQTACPTVAVNEGVNALKLQMESGDPLNGIHRFPAQFIFRQ